MLHTPCFAPQEIFLQSQINLFLLRQIDATRFTVKSEKLPLIHGAPERKRAGLSVYVCVKFVFYIGFSFLSFHMS
jgi:hypothetical protein